MEDDTIGSMCLQSQLERFGHEVLAVAYDGSQAVKLAGELAPELVVMDVSLPKVTGIEAARQILAQNTIPIIFLSGFTLDELKDTTGEFAQCACLSKPVSSVELQAAIEAVCTR
ncbi:MAG: response regulator [Chloroflexi bacterium]|nr:response regulator [Chloroflexota bacterium]